MTRKCYILRSIRVCNTVIYALKNLQHSSKSGWFYKKEIMHIFQALMILVALPSAVA